MIRLACSFILMTCLLLLTACGSHSGTTTNIAGGHWNVRLGGDWPQLDPQLPSSATTKNQFSNVVFQALYDDLVTLTGGKLAGYAAKSWSITPTSVSFTLRSDLQCVDGSTLKASDVEASFKRLLTSDKPELPGLFGPGPYTVSSDNTAGTFTFTVGTPYSDLMYGFADAATAILCHAASVTSAQLSEQAGGTGAFTIVSTTHGDSVSLKVRPQWAWGPNGVTARSSGFPQSLTFKIVANETTAANLLLTGGLDVGDVSGPDVQRLSTSKDLTKTVFKSFNVTPMFMNQLPGRPANDLQVRKALMTAVDPMAWNQAAYGGNGVPATSVLASTAPCYDPQTAKLVPKPSTSQAKAILVADGYVPDSSGKLQKNGKPLMINVIGYSAQNRGADYLAAQFEAAGMTVKLETLDYNAWSPRLGNSQWDVTTFVDFVTQNPAYLGQAQYWHGATLPGRNRSTIMDPAVETAISNAGPVPPSGRCAAWGEVQRVLLQNFDLLPLAAPERDYFGRGLVAGPNASGYFSPILSHRIA